MAGAVKKKSSKATRAKRSVDAPEVARTISFSAKLLRPQSSELAKSAAVGDADDWMFLVLPRRASDALPSRSKVSVKGAINGKPFISTFEPDGDGGHWLKVDRKLQKTSGAKVGDVIRFEVSPLSPAEEPEPQVPADLRKALADAPSKARETWSGITAIARRDWIHWIVSPKQAETRAKRIRTACDKLSKGDRRPCCFDRSGKYDKSLSCPLAEADE